MRGKGAPYKQNHSCGKSFTLRSIRFGKLPIGKYVPKLELRSQMRDRTIPRLWYVRSKQILNLSGGSTRIIIILSAALEMGPVCNQDRNADARRIGCAGVPYEKGLS